MFYLTFKLLLLMMIYQIYTKTHNALIPAVTWGILTFIMKLFGLGFTLELFWYTSLIFITAYSTFFLANYFTDSMWELLILVLGISLLWVI